MLERDVAKLFLAETVAQAQAAHLMSRDHFSADGSLIEAWASLKSFKRRDEGWRKSSSGRSEFMQFAELRRQVRHCRIRPRVRQSGLAIADGDDRLFLPGDQIHPLAFDGRARCELLDGE